MKNKTNLEEEGLVWTAYLQFNNSWKNREYNIEIHLLFRDYVKALKAFHLVVRIKLWEIMAEKGFPTHLIRTAQSM
jgi:hypothetical protein